MSCDEIRALLWDSRENTLDEQENVAAHVAHCAECARYADEIDAMRRRLRQPVAVDPQRLGQQALASVESTIAADRGASSGNRWRPAFAFFATAAMAVLAIVTFAPRQTEALSLYALTTQHRLCLIEGHNANFRCGSEAAFAEMTIKELGLTPRPFEAPKDAFRKGDICRIGGAMVAHALLDVQGNQVSYFRLYDAEEKLRNEGSWTAAGEGVWWQKREGRLIVMRQIADKDYGLYTGDITLDAIRQLWRAGEAD